MAEIVVTNHLTLDGVMQGPAGRDEDPSEGFVHGGWAAANQDQVMGDFMASRIGSGGSLLLGRRTYELLFRSWHGRSDNPFTELLDSRPKYVASTTLREPLPWQNSTLLDANVPATVAELKRSRDDGNIGILGSGELIRSLMAHDLIDEFVLPIHPVVLGSGRRMFSGGGPPTSLRLVQSAITTTGVVIAVYRRAASTARADGG